MNAENTIKRSPVGIELVRALATEGYKIFTTEQARELASRVGIKDSYLCESLYHLRQNGWIDRIRRGLYSLSYTVSEMAPVHDFEIAMNLANPAAISCWSAMNFHGFTDQIPGRVVVMSTTEGFIPRPRKSGHRSASRGGYLVGDAIFQFFQVKPEHFFGFQEVCINGGRVLVTDPERTLLDGLSFPQHCGSLGESLHAFNVRGDNLDIERIVDYALRLDAAAAKRLGWVLEYYDFDLSRFRKLLDLPVKGYRKLDPTGPGKGPCNRRWMIQENLPGKISS